MGRLAIDKSSISITIEPSIITVIYNPESSYVTTTPVECTPTMSVQACVFTQPISSISTVYTSTITTLFTGSFCKPSTMSASITNTSPSISQITITVEKSLPCLAVLPTTQPNQSSLSSSVVVGGVMGYFIFFILCIIGTVGGFFCGRSSARQQRMEMSAINPTVICSVNDYEGRRNAIRSGILNKNQTLPLPKPPHNNDEEIYDDTGIYMEMDNLQKEMTYENSGAIAAM